MGVFIDVHEEGKHNYIMLNSDYIVSIEPDMREESRGKQDKGCRLTYLQGSEVVVIYVREDGERLGRKLPTP
ncbi:MAG: hypothetical protein AAF542_00060 [Pseudomonadota bacterium]